MSFGRRSKSLKLILLDPKIEQMLHKLNRFNRVKRKDEILEKPSPMAEELKPLRDYVVPSVEASPSSICHPTIDANNFEIIPAIISMIRRSSIFCGLFPFSLKNKVKAWLTSQPPNSITTWDDLAKKFLAKFFPFAKTAKLRNDIISFAQNDMEPFYEACDIYKDMLRKCPHHALPTCMQIQSFYNGLNSTSRTMIDAAAEGVLMEKHRNEAHNLLEEMAFNNYQWSSERSTPKKDGIHEIDTISTLTEQISTFLNNLVL
ncbi:hypothetical protein L3X38_042127 [Prunus dulcis]|uniref:Retrotransposon gag domain-containing protein n=1 Tax=Prunus dulcis TaxID=3755 RepID=A0AAD4YLP3_PRUDU|nr:hypothetical protein L3X38_042127 [Prunus dulcis]